LGWTFEGHDAPIATVDTVTDIHTDPGADRVEVGADVVTPHLPAATVMARCEGEPVADVVERSESFDELALFASWHPYVFVDDLEYTLSLVEPAGGVVLSPPTRRGEQATVAVILDPNDAMLSLWEPVGRSGPGVSHDHAGAFAWLELETPDLDTAKKFYAELFGWDAGEVSVNDDELGRVYTVFTRMGERVAGAVESAISAVAASWCPSFAVADVDAATTVAIRNGGVLLSEPADIPVGRQALIVDPAGAVFSVLGPKPLGPRPL
jgi:predicted enzyme related to lactoylglutathione lyase